MNIFARYFGGKAKSKTHDLVRVDYGFTPYDEGQTGSVVSWTGPKPKAGDFLILRNGDRTTRYIVESMANIYDPPDQWIARVKFAPRKGLQTH